MTWQEEKVLRLEYFEYLEQNGLDVTECTFEEFCSSCADRYDLSDLGNDWW